MRLKLSETKPHLTLVLCPRSKKKTSHHKPLLLPFKLDSLAYFALALIHDHGRPRQHLWETCGSKWRVGRRRDHGAGWRGAASISFVAAARLQIGELADQPSEPGEPTRTHPYSHDTLRLHLRHIHLCAYLSRPLLGCSPCLSTGRDDVSHVGKRPQGLHPRLLSSPFQPNRLLSSLPSAPIGYAYGGESS